MRIGYARISDKDQSLPLQSQALQQAGCEQVYEERTHGQTTRRPLRAACLKALRGGDTLVVWRLDRSLSDPIQLAAELQVTRVLLADGQVPVRAIAARLSVAPSTVYRNLTEPAGPDGSSDNPAPYV